MRFLVVLLLGAALLAGCAQGGVIPAGSTAAPQSDARTAQAPLIGRSPKRRYDTRLLPAGFTPMAVMKDGQIPGYRGNEAAIVTAMRPDAVKLLGTLPGYSASVATSVNTSGVAVGYATNDPFKDLRALEFSGGKVIDLKGHNYGPLFVHEENRANSINDSGTIVGSELIGADSNVLEFFILGREAVQAPNGADCSPPVINNAGEYVAQGGGGGVCTNIPALSGQTFYSAPWIDEAGDVVGTTGYNEPFPAIALLHRGAVTVIPTPQGVDDNPSAVDEVNGVVEFVGPSDPETAYVYEHGKFTELADLTGAGSPSLVNAIGLDDAGDIVAREASRPWVLLTPIDDGAIRWNHGGGT
ncbi:MAG: hypothetical protein ACLQPV_05940 [Vulcanimicrobiaceae bacterium]